MPTFAKASFVLFRQVVSYRGYLIFLMLQGGFLFQRLPSVQTDLSEQSRLFQRSAFDASQVPSSSESRLPLPTEIQFENLKQTCKIADE